MSEVHNIIEQNTVDQVATINKKQNSNFFTSIRDFFNGLHQWNLWLYLAYTDIRKRYRRTVIGPLWATLSIAIFIASMGFIFSILWHRKIHNYLPFFASGYIVWIYFSTTLTESCTTFTAMESYIKQISLPYSFYAFLVVSRNVMVFFHQFIIFIVMAFLFHIPITYDTLLAIPGFLLLALNCSWIAIALGILCARFRDIQQIVISILQIAMFITPIFWSGSQLGTSKAAFLIVNLNPIYHFISVVRYPLLGEKVQLISWIANITILLLGWLFTMVYLGRNYNKLIYWL